MSANIRPAGVFDVNYGQDIAINRTRTDRILANGWFVLLLIVPLVTLEGPLGLSILPTAWISFIVDVCIFAIAVQGLNILVGYTGQISLGHAAFMAVGAYASAILGRQLGMPFWLAVPLAALFTGGVGVLFGLPSLRVKGFYLAMATLAAQFIIPWFIRYPLDPLTNGSRPLEVPVPALGPLTLGRDIAFYYVIVPVTVFLMLAARNLIRTRVGRAFISVRDNDVAAELLGINVFAYKLQAFFLSALYAGVAGALLAYNDNIISLDIFPLTNSIEMLAMLVIGGAGFPLGAVMGVAFVKLLNVWLIPIVLISNLRLGDFLINLLPFLQPVNITAAMAPMLFGIALVIFLVLEPRGLAYRWEILKIAWKLRPYSYAGTR